jgi:hypothetical protein
MSWETLTCWVVAMALAGCGGAARSPQTPANAELPDNADVRACATDDLDRCKEAADYLKGPGANAQGRALITRWRVGCDNGDGNDCYRSAMISDVPIVTIELVDRACLMGVPLACWKLGKGLNHLPDIGDTFDAPIDTLTHACNRDERPACVALGAIYYLGRKDVARDTKRAFAYLRIACDRLHDEEACGQSQFLECKLNRVSECPTRPVNDGAADTQKTMGEDEEDYPTDGVEGGVEGGEAPDETPPPPPPPPPPAKKRR